MVQEPGELVLVVAAGLQVEVHVQVGRIHESRIEQQAPGAARVPAFELGAQPGALLVEAAADRMPFHFLLGPGEPVPQSPEWPGAHELADLTGIDEGGASGLAFGHERVVEALLEIRAIAQDVRAEALDEIEVGCVGTTGKLRHGLWNGAPTRQSSAPRAPDPAGRRECASVATGESGQ